MRSFFLSAAFVLAGCSSVEQALSSGPSDAEMRAAYMMTDDVKLGSSLMDGKIQLAEFKKLNCAPDQNGIFRCRFFARFDVSAPKDEGEALISRVIGSQSSYFREALFFKNSSGTWTCAQVVPLDGLEKPATP